MQETLEFEYGEQSTEIGSTTRISKECQGLGIPTSYHWRRGSPPLSAWKFGNQFPAIAKALLLGGVEKRCLVLIESNPKDWRSATDYQVRVPMRSVSDNPPERGDSILPALFFITVIHSTRNV
jgi:hypothetical protein